MALTHEDHVAGGHAAATANRARIAERAALDAVVRPMVTDLVAEHSADRIGTELVERAARMARHIMDTAPDAETALEAKQLMEAAALAHKMGRLELGQSTANTATFAVDRQVGRQELEQRLAALGEADTP